MLQSNELSISGGTFSARFNFDLKKNGAAISGVTKANGPVRSGAQSSVDDVLTVALPAAGLVLAAGDSLEVVLEIEVTATGTTSTWLVQTTAPSTSSVTRLLFELLV